MVRRYYEVAININGKEISELIIDSHYLEKHAESVNDKVIMELVKMLDGGEFVPEKVSKEGFEYYVEDKMNLEGKMYRLIWLLKSNEIYIGVVNCYRRK